MEMLELFIYFSYDFHEFFRLETKATLCIIQNDCHLYSIFSEVQLQDNNISNYSYSLSACSINKAHFRYVQYIISLFISRIDGNTMAVSSIYSEITISQFVILQLLRPLIIMRI